jgi:hypothetical protein
MIKIRAFVLISAVVIIGAPVFAHRCDAAQPPSFIVTLPKLNQIAFVDPTSRAITQFRPLPGGPTFVVLDATRPLAFMLVNGASQIAEYDYTQRRVRATIPLAVAASDMVINPGGDRIYASGQHLVVVVSTVQHSMVTTIDLGAPVGGVAVGAADQKIYASIPSTNRVAVINAHTFQVMRMIRMGTCRFVPCDISALGAGPGGRYVLGASGEGVFVAIDTATDTLVAKQDLGEPIFDHTGQPLGFDTLSNAAYFALNGGTTSWIFSVLAAPPFTTTGQIRVGGGNGNYQAIAFDAADEGFATVPAAEGGGGGGKVLILSHGSFYSIHFPSEVIGIAYIP